VPAQNQAAIAIRTAIDHVVQMNQDQRFSYDRDALVKMPDEVLERAKQRR